MKLRIAFASDGEGLESRVAHHFGRCRYFVFVSVEDEKIKEAETRKNPFFENHEPGAVPEFIADMKANVIIAGSMGPSAIDWFRKFGIKTITAKPEKIKNVLNDYLRGSLSGAESCSEHV